MILELEIGGETLRVAAEDSAASGVIITRALDDITDALYDAARSLVGVKTGAVRDRGIARDDAHRTGPSTWEGNVGLRRVPRHGITHHDGSGLLGRRRRNITPTQGNVLAFPAGGRIVFARSVKGQKPNPFMRDAMLLINRTYVPVRVKLLARELGATG